MITLFSVAVGGIISYTAVKWQLDKQLEAQYKKEKEIADQYVELIKFELDYNLKNLLIMKNSLDLVPHANLEHWEWMVQIANSFIFDAYNALVSSGFQKCIPKDVECSIYCSYTNLKIEINMVKSAFSKHKFYLKFNDNKQAMEDELKQVKSYNNDIIPSMENALSEINKYSTHTNEQKIVKVILAPQVLTTKVNGK